jgi:hypothetical protein
MSTRTLDKTDPEAQEFEAERRRNEEQTLAHREGRDQPLPDKSKREPKE